MKKLVSVFLSILMILSVLPMAVPAVLAADEPVYATGYVGLGDYTAPALGEGEEGDGAGDAVSIPAQFSLADKMPAPRNQNPYGTCWAFSTLASAESNLIMQGLVSKNEIDLSEMQLIYYMYHPTVDKLGNITPGEGSSRTDGELSGGGRFDYAMNVLSHWNGIAYETDHDNFVYGTYGSNVPALNSDWDASLATDYNDYIVKGYYAINNQENREELKAAIMENGAATVSYFHDDAYYNSAAKAYFSGDKHKGSSNHAVSIVGWDDTYAVENFGELKPENPGAWLIRNSWGANWGLGGYFWLSYEDQSIEDTSFIALMQKADAYDNNYFFDGGNMYHPSAKVLGAVNKFTAKGSELLKAVSVVFPEDTNVNYSVDIYVNPGENSAFSSWQSVASAHTEGATTYAGMYTVELANAVPLSAGDVFAVAITADKPVIISYDKPDTTTWFVNNAFYEDDSSYFINGAGNLTSMATRGVARIKAYTETIDGNTVTVSADDLQLCTGAVINAADYLTVDPDTAKLTFTVSDTSVATVDENGNVTAVAPGEATLEVRCAAANTRATAPITVKAHELRDVEAKEPTCTEPGNAAYRQCANCKKIFIDSAEATDEQIAALVIPADGHALTNIPASAVTDYTDGNIEYWYCSVCEKYFADENGENEIALADTVISASYALTKVARKEATCTKDGNVEYYKVTDKATGEFVKYVDADLNDIAEADLVIPASHTLIHTAAVASSCVTGKVGNIEYWQCDVCGRYFADEAAATEITYSKTIAYPKHTMTKTAAKAPTCTEDGNIQYYTCSVCKRYYKYASGSTELAEADLAIPATGHSAVDIAAKAPTCTEAGYEAYYTCKNCNKLFSDKACTAELAAPAVIDALGHDYQSEVTLAPTCTMIGITTYTCSRCGDTYQEPIAATGHTYVDGTCTGCGLTQEEIERAEIAELGGPECEYCGRHHGTSWFADFIYAVHGLFKFFKDLFAKIG